MYPQNAHVQANLYLHLVVELDLHPDLTPFWLLTMVQALLTAHCSSGQLLDDETMDL